MSSSAISDAGTDPSTYKSYTKDMHKIKGIGIVNTVLQEGHEFMNNGISQLEPTRNKKELHIDKISERELIPQTSMNPFLHGIEGNYDQPNSNTQINNTQINNSNYINDISAQEKYLIPQNSNMFC